MGRDWGRTGVGPPHAGAEVGGGSHLPALSWAPGAVQTLRGLPRGAEPGPGSNEPEVGRAPSAVGFGIKLLQRLPLTSELRE